MSGCLLISSSWWELFSGLEHYSMCVQLMTKVGGGWIKLQSNPIRNSNAVGRGGEEGGGAGLVVSRSTENQTKT